MLENQSGRYAKWKFEIGWFWSDWEEDYLKTSSESSAKQWVKERYKFALKLKLITEKPNKRIITATNLPKRPFIE